ncbi:hypothetical protein KSS87_015674 [Heliosperma pusillum]|nr:hypothetical protein KSS87_015674 [Heliosperma pusillum]
MPHHCHHHQDPRISVAGVTTVLPSSLAPPPSPSPYHRRPRPNPKNPTPHPKSLPSPLKTPKYGVLRGEGRDFGCGGWVFGVGSWSSPARGSIGGTSPARGQMGAPARSRGKHHQRRCDRWCRLWWWDRVVPRVVFKWWEEVGKGNSYLGGAGWQDNIDLFCRARNNINDINVILNNMRQFSGKMSQMQDLPISIDQNLVNRILPRTTLVVSPI